MPRNQTRVTIRRTGQWGKARRTFRGLAVRLRRAVNEGMGEEAEGAVRRLKNNIFAQQYSHAPLSSWQSDYKAENALDPRILVEKGDYVRSIDSFRLGKDEWGIGVQDEEQGDKGRLLEFGGINNLGKKVPERPHLRVELERIKNGRLPVIRDAMRDVLRGKVL